MRSTVARRLLFTLTVIATLSMICSEACARGRGGGGGRSGGGRSGGGRAGASGGGRDMSSRAGGVVSKPGKLSDSKLGSHSGKPGPGQVGNRSLGKGNLSSRAGGLRSGLADKGQLQGLLGKQSGQLSGNRPQQNGQFQQNAQAKANQFQGGAQPFTASWYVQHPNVWQATHPRAGAAVVASTAAVAAWVGAGYYAPASSGGSSTTIVYQAPPEEARLEEASPVTVLANGTPTTSAQPANTEEWFPVGIYALATTENSPALLMLQLLVDHQGTLRGVYYDSVTDSSHNLVGTLNPNTKIAKWRLESNSQVSFQASLDELTQPSGILQVTVPSGLQQWQLARVESQQ